MSLIAKALQKAQSKKSKSTEKPARSFSPHLLLNFSREKKENRRFFALGLGTVLLLLVIGVPFSLFFPGEKKPTPLVTKIIASNNQISPPPSPSFTRPITPVTKVNTPEPDSLPAPSPSVSPFAETKPSSPAETSNNQPPALLPEATTGNKVKKSTIAKIQPLPPAKKIPAVNPLPPKAIDFDSCLKKALIYSQVQNFPAALKCYNQILSTNPRFFDALINRGIIRQKMGDTKGAKQDLLKAYEINPEDPVLLNALGVVYLETGEATRAEELFLKANNIPALINLSLHYWEKGDKEKVVSLLCRAEKTDSSDPYPAYYLGLFYHQIGENDLAREKLNQALSLAQKKGRLDLVQEIDSLIPLP